MVIRDAARNPIFKRLIAQIPPLNEPAAKQVEAQGGRKVWTMAGAPIRWWYEKDDVVFSFAPPGAADPVVDVLDGKAPSALKHPARTRWRRPDRARSRSGCCSSTSRRCRPCPREAAELGLDGIKRVEASWGIHGKGMVTTLGVRAPRPRRGVLALFDQPPIGAGTGSPGPGDDRLHAPLDRPDQDGRRAPGDDEAERPGLGRGAS